MPRLRAVVRRSPVGGRCGDNQNSEQLRPTFVKSHLTPFLKAITRTCESGEALVVELIGAARL